MLRNQSGRLQQELWNECVVDFRGYSPTNLETFAEPQLLQVQIRLGKFEFFPDTDQVRGAMLQGRPEQLGERKKHRLGGLLICVDQRRETLQRVRAGLPRRVVCSRS